MTNVVLIFGYNNTRIYDVKRLKNLSSQKLGAEILLCKDDISNADRELTPYTLQVSLKETAQDKLKQLTVIIDEYLASKALTPVACLPFSDSGVPLGSYYAAYKNLPHDEPGEKALACLDKYIFRELEKNNVCPGWYKRPIFQKTHSIEEAKNILENAGRSIFFKPTSEGNSRGCIRISSVNELEASTPLLEKYIKNGVIAEESIDDCKEYSFDGINGQYIITEKTTSTGACRVELQHILPAPLNKSDYDQLIEAGKFVQKVTGSNGGAVHHELFFNAESKNVYCVEPNRRPAGQKIWDAIDATYPGANYWEAWFDWASGNKQTIYEMKDNQIYTGIRMLTSKHNGILHKINKEALDKLSNKVGMLVLEISKQESDTITSSPKDNSDFLGYFIFQRQSSNELREMLITIEAEIVRALEIG